MEHIISIDSTKPNTIEFDLSVQGIDTSDIEVRFIIKTEHMCIGFQAEENQNNWIVKLPEMVFLHAAPYPFKIEVIADGYFFQPLNGTIKVVNSPEVKATAPHNVTLKPAEEEEESCGVSEEVEDTDPAETIADTILKKHKSPTLKRFKRMKESVNSEKDSKIKQILESLRH